MKQIHKLLKYLNRYQQRHHLPGFICAVIKKYNEDSAGRQAALLTYYSFLSLFPLLLIVTTLTDKLINQDPQLRARVIKGVTGYFPLLGNQLSSNVHRLHTGGLALVIGILLTLYGTHGVADAFRRSVQKTWLIPRNRRDKFPKSTIKSLCLIIVGGAGFILASILAAITAEAGHGLTFRLLSVLVNFIILFVLFSFLLNLSLPRHVTLKELRVGALCAAINLVILQLAAGYIIGRELKKLDALYSYFAVTLGLLFWIYLQVEVILYSIEIAVVSSKKLWPRSFDAQHPTDVDNRLYPT